MNACKLDFEDESFDGVLFSFNGIDYIYPEKNDSRRLGKYIESSKRMGYLYIVLITHGASLIV